MFSDIVYKLLDNALDYGISEFDFWNMTIAELNRAVESKKRVQMRQAQERASFDYILADLIGRSVGRIYNSSNKLPTLAEVYPSLFDAEAEQEAIQEKKDELSALRFKQFAESFNNNFNKEANRDE